MQLMMQLQPPLGDCAVSPFPHLPFTLSLFLNFQFYIYLHRLPLSYLPLELEPDCGSSSRDSLLVGFTLVFPLLFFRSSSSSALSALFSALSASDFDLPLEVFVVVDLFELDLLPVLPVLTASADWDRFGFSSTGVAAVAVADDEAEDADEDEEEEEVEEEEADESSDWKETLESVSRVENFCWWTGLSPPGVPGPAVLADSTVPCASAGNAVLNGLARSSGASVDRARER